MIWWGVVLEMWIKVELLAKIVPVSPKYRSVTVDSNGVWPCSHLWCCPIKRALAVTSQGAVTHLHGRFCGRHETDSTAWTGDSQTAPRVPLEWLCLRADYTLLLQLLRGSDTCLFWRRGMLGEWGYRKWTHIHQYSVWHQLQSTCTCDRCRQRKDADPQWQTWATHAAKQKRK